MNVENLIKQNSLLGVKKIVLVGAPGSGKTTLGKKLGTELGLPLVEADKFFWKLDGSQCGVSEFRELIAADLKDREEWIFEGHFKTCHDIVLKDATLVIIIDKNFWSSFFNYSLREIKRRDADLKTKCKKIFYVPMNYKKILSIRNQALKNYGGKILTIK